MPAIAVGQATYPALTDRYRRQASSHIDLRLPHHRVSNDRIRGHSHKFRAILANRAAYCIELDSHKGFAA